DDEVLVQDRAGGRAEHRPRPGADALLPDLLAPQVVGNDARGAEVDVDPLAVADGRVRGVAVVGEAPAGAELRQDGRDRLRPDRLTGVAIDADEVPLEV